MNTKRIATAFAVLAATTVSFSAFAASMDEMCIRDRYKRFFFAIIKLRRLLSHNLVKNEIRSGQNIFMRPEILRQIDAALYGVIHEPIRIVLVHK